MTLTFALAFLSSYVFVFLKASQQLHVVHGQYLLVVPTSLAMAACEVYVVFSAATQGWGWIVLPIGIGSGLGAVSAMWLNTRSRRLNSLLTRSILKSQLVESDSTWRK